MRHSVLIFLMTALISVHAARAEGTRGGGDDAGLEFQADANAAIELIQKFDPVLFRAIRGEELLKTARDMKVLVTNDPLFVRLDGVEQNSIAINDPSLKTVTLNRKRWNGIDDDLIRSGVALHEVLSLEGLESTGKYSYSSEFVESVGDSDQDLLNAEKDTPSPQNFQEGYYYCKPQTKCRLKDFRFQRTFDQIYMSGTYVFNGGKTAPFTVQMSSLSGMISARYPNGVICNYPIIVDVVPSGNSYEVMTYAPTAFLGLGSRGACQSSVSTIDWSSMMYLKAGQD